MNSIFFNYQVPLRATDSSGVESRLLDGCSVLSVSSKFIDKTRKEAWWSISSG